MDLLTVDDSDHGIGRFGTETHQRRGNPCGRKDRSGTQGAEQHMKVPCLGSVDAGGLARPRAIEGGIKTHHPRPGKSTCQRQNANV